MAVDSNKIPPLYMGGFKYGSFLKNVWIQSLPLWVICKQIDLSLGTEDRIMTGVSSFNGRYFVSLDELESRRPTIIDLTLGPSL